MISNSVSEDVEGWKPEESRKYIASEKIVAKQKKGKIKGRSMHMELHKLLGGQVETSSLSGS